MIDAVCYTCLTGGNDSGARNAYVGLIVPAAIMMISDKNIFFIRRLRYYNYNDNKFKLFKLVYPYIHKALSKIFVAIFWFKIAKKKTTHWSRLIFSQYSFFRFSGCIARWSMQLICHTPAFLSAYFSDFRG